MNEFESKMYMRVLDQRDEAVKIFKRILKIMKSDQREGDRYVYEEEKKIKEFLAQAGEGAAIKASAPATGIRKAATKERVPASRRTAAKRSLKQPGASSSKRSPKPSKR